MLKRDSFATVFVVLVAVLPIFFFVLLFLAPELGGTVLSEIFGENLL